MSVNGLGRKILVAAFEGWNDAGEAASGLVNAVRGTTETVVVHEVDPELYFDYQYTRPSVAFQPDGSRALTWPGASISVPADAGDSPDEVQFVTLRGVEPARSWQAFVAELVDVALREDVTALVCVGSMMSDVPHTRPITIFASSENEDLRKRFQLERSTYEGPVGILTVLAQAAEEAGIPTLGLWASVPHYLGGATPSPKATLALLKRLSEYAGAEIDPGDLETQASAWEASVDAAAADDEDLTEYIKELERHRDTWDSPEASGEALAEEFERYLRHRGDGPPQKPGR